MEAYGALYDPLFVVRYQQNWLACVLASEPSHYVGKVLKSAIDWCSSRAGTAIDIARTSLALSPLCLSLNAGSAPVTGSQVRDLVVASIAPAITRWSVGETSILHKIAHVSSWVIVAGTWMQIFHVPIFSKVLDLCTVRCNTDYRPMFRDLEVVFGNPQNTPHPQAAVIRSACDHALDQLILTMGKEVWSISRSHADERAGYGGTRDYYWIRDMFQKSTGIHFTPRNVVYKMIDVDYYTNIGDYLDGHDVLLYTFAPVEPAGTIPNGVYSSDNNMVTMMLLGNAPYTHPLWDYNTDVLHVHRWYGTLIYRVDHRVVPEDPTRRLVYLEYKATVYAWHLWSGAFPKRREFTHNIDSTFHKRVNIMKCVRNIKTIPTQEYYSISWPGQTTCVTVDATTLETVYSTLRVSKDIAIGNVERIIHWFDTAENENGYSYIHPNVKTAATYMTELAMVHWRVLPETDRQTLVNAKNVTFQPAYPLIFEELVPTMRVLFPGYGYGYAPAKGYNSDYQCIMGRVQSTRNNTTFRNKPFEYRCLNEFIRLLIPDDIAGTGCPVDYERVQEQFKRPNQRSMYQQAKHYFYIAKFWISSFMKREAYGKMTDPRNISTVTTDHKVRLSTYTLAMAEVLKKTPWYAFGHNPQELTEAVRLRTQSSKFAVSADISRFDGTCGPIQTAVILACYKRYFGSKYTPELERLLVAERNATAFTAFGIKYDTGDTRVSGSPDTSVGNTLNNANMSYVALRRSINEPKQAWNRLGFYGGDDSVNYDLDPKCLVDTYKAFGFTLKADIIQAGMPLPFLGRVWLDPWHSDVNTADVARQVHKLHMSTTPPEVPLEVALYNKAIAYLQTDQNTSILTAWSRKIVEFTMASAAPQLERWAAVLHHDTPWWSQFDATFKPCDNKYDDIVVVASGFGTTPDAIMSFENAIESCTSLAQVLGLKFVVSQEEIAAPKFSVCYRGEFYCAKDVPIPKPVEEFPTVRPIGPEFNPQLIAQAVVTGTPNAAVEQRVLAPGVVGVQRNTGTHTVWTRTDNNRQSQPRRQGRGGRNPPRGARRQ